jgi:hypothetical protein
MAGQMQTGTNAAAQIAHAMRPMHKHPMLAS